MRYVHRLAIHSKVNYTLSLIRQKYWIPQGRQCIKSILNECVTCKKIDGPAYRAPTRPPLPFVRVTLTRPYDTVGLDYTASFNILDISGEIRKIYILLMTCTAIRHIHLEVGSDMSLHGFLLAFRRFCSSKSEPRLIISDNFSTFKACAEIFKPEDVCAELAKKGIIWQFIPNRSPWMGGHYERMVGVVKTGLKRAVGRALLSYEEMLTVTAEVCAAVNDRPISYVNNEIGDAEPLTPSELYCGRRSITLEDSLDPDELNDPSYGENLRERYLKLKVVLKSFWEQWKFDYLTALRQQHPKFGSPDTQVKIGDVVLVYPDDKTPRSQWKLAIVTQLNPGRDSVVRSVDLRMSSGKTTNRPITKLFPLEVNDKEFANSLKSDTSKPIVIKERPQRSAKSEALKRISEQSKL